MIVGDDIRGVEVAGEVSWNGAAEFLHAANGPHEAAPTHDILFRLRLRVVHSSTGCVRAGDAVHGRQTVSTALDERRSSFSRSENTIPFDLQNRVDIGFAIRSTDWIQPIVEFPPRKRENKSFIVGRTRDHHWQRMLRAACNNVASF